MIKLVLIAFVVVSSIGCDSTRPVTANPDKQTTTSGTVGSAKMTNTLPETADTTRAGIDSLQKRP